MKNAIIALTDRWSGPRRTAPAFRKYAVQRNENYYPRLRVKRPGPQIKRYTSITVTPLSPSPHFPERKVFIPL
jgi:hypothetical protein